MERFQFQVGYDGPALESNEMDVRELAPALLAVADLLQEANRVINGDRAQVSVNIKGAFKSGSFIIDFVANQRFIDQMMQMFTQDNIRTAKDLVEMLFGGGAFVGLVKLILWLKNRKPQKVKELKNGKVRFVLEGEGQGIEVVREVANLYRDVSVRRALDSATRPLIREGINRLYTVDADTPDKITSIEKTDRDYFALPNEKDMESPDIEDQTITTHLQFVNLCFQEGGKSKFKSGDEIYFATIADKDFVQKMEESRVAFSKGDILHVRMHIRKWETPDGLKSEYTITKVLEHRPAMTQLFLPITKEQ